ncbi:MAG: AAA family ATPase [Solirubrobacterales bacterium]
MGADTGAQSEMIEVRLLGGFKVSSPDGPITIDSARLRSLLALLIITRGEEQPRERLAYLFWPDSAESQARTNMRQAIHRLRQTLPEPDRFISIEKSSIAWRREAPAKIDVAEFESCASSHDPLSLIRAVELYAGDLYPECFDDWIAPARERLREQFLSTLDRVAGNLESERDYRRALPMARLVLDADPLNEEALVRVMRLHALGGDRSAALREYHDFATSLARETGVEPGPATREAYERLLEPGEVLEAEEDAGPFIGREHEWADLRDAWRRASRGAALLVAITGEAGIGKSRLAEELRSWVARQGFPVATSKCYSAAGLAYAPLMELLRSDPVARQIRLLADPWLVELSRLIPELREVHPDLPHPLPLADKTHRTRLLEGAARAVLASDGPVLLVVDDVQWCDTETIDWLRYLLRSNPSAPILIVATARSEELHSNHAAHHLILEGGANDQAARLDLEPLGPEDTVALAQSVAGRDLEAESSGMIFRETEGNPLFVVEWTRAGLVGQPGHVPPRVQSVIETRFAQLSNETQELASLAATIGRAFGFDVLASASSSPEAMVIEALDELRDRRIVRELPGATYDFSHDKLREAAYKRASMARRRMLHRRAAQAIESQATELESVAAELAVHYEEAGWIDRAASFYAKAAEAAHRVYSNERAIGLFEKALSLLGDEPESSRRDRRELALRTALGAPLVSIEGYGAPRVHREYLRAEELCERLGTPPAPPVLRGLALVSIARGELERAQNLGEQLLAAGASGNDATVKVEGNYVLGVTSFWLGEFERSRKQLELALDLYDPDRAHTHLAVYSQDPRVICLSRLAFVLHYLGESDEADERAREAIECAEELEHPFSLAYALNFTAWLAIERGDKAVARERAERMATLVDDQQLAFLRPMGTVLRGWLLAEEGAADEAIASIREGLAVYAESGWSLHQPYALTLLARVCLQAGREEDARGAIVEALEVCARTGQHYLDSELSLLESRLPRA